MGPFGDLLPVVVAFRNIYAGEILQLFVGNVKAPTEREREVVGPCQGFREPGVYKASV